jgi:hypothetical protein
MPRTERQLWNSLRQKLPKKTHCQRIENRAGEGMPDVYLCMDGVPVWAELKITNNDRFSISKSQIAWHLGHSRCGGVSFFLVHEPPTGLVFLFDGGLAPELHGSRLSVLRPAALWCGDIGAAPCALRAAAHDRWSCVLRPASDDDGASMNENRDGL